MTAEVHPTAIVDPTAEVGDGVWIGPYAVIGAEVALGDGTQVGASAQVAGPARIGARNRIFPHACVGLEPQDLKYGGGRVSLEVGDGNVFREFCTVHRGTEGGGGVTTIGNRNLFMVYTHVAHDCRVGDGTIFSNAATLAGHVEVDDHAVIGAFSAVHQHCRVGRFAYIGGYSVITMDALPFAKTVGVKPACYGLNRIGLERQGFDAETLARLDRAIRLLTRSRLNTAQALEQIRAELGGTLEVDHLVAFVAKAKRGVITALPGGRRSRGG